MKKSLLLIASLIGLGSASVAQCVVDTECSNLICPETELPEGKINEEYSAFFTLNVPSDTTVNLGAPLVGVINFAEITGVTGLPSGGSFNYQCQDAGCKINGGSAGCFEISGSPTDDEAGSYEITVNYSVNYSLVTNPLTGATTDFDFPSTAVYELIINGLESSILAKDLSFSIYPNPASETLSITSSTDGEFNLLNSAGNSVLKGEMSTNTVIDVSPLSQGHYFIKLKNATEQVVKKIVVE
jgi:hypothetical protein